MAVVGTALLVLGPRGTAEIAGRFGAGLSSPSGGAVICGDAVTAKRVLSRTAPLPVAAITFGLAALFLAPALALERAPGPDLIRAAPSSSTWASAPPPSPTRFSRRLAPRAFPTTVAGIVGLLEPLTAATLGVAVFGESSARPAAGGRSSSPPSSS